MDGGSAERLTWVVVDGNRLRRRMPVVPARRRCAASRQRGFRHKEVTGQPSIYDGLAAAIVTLAAFDARSRGLCDTHCGTVAIAPPQSGRHTLSYTGYRPKYVRGPVTARCCTPIK